MELAAVVLAAGKGTRMKSELPKVLHKICGQTMASYVVKAVKGAGAQQVILVVGYRGELVAQAFQTQAAIVRQEPQLGTAHALLQTEEMLASFSGCFLVISGDMPLISEGTLKALVNAHAATGAAATVLTAVLEENAGYGRIIRDRAGRVVKIVEERDATAQERAIKEVNTGIYCFSSPGLFNYLRQIEANNAQKEYYLTDLIALYAKDGRPVAAFQTPRPSEALGINDRRQMAEAEAILRRRKLDELMLSGVTIIDPASVFLDQGVTVGQDSIIYPFTVLEGNCVVGENCVLGPGAHLKESRLGEGVSVLRSVVVESVVEDGCQIGPFSYLRPGCHLKQKVKIGDFVEVKKTQIGENSKVPHLSYLGDATVGAGVNVGAGTITCNYDGKQKWPTQIGDGAFIGSNTNLVAPVQVGAKAVIGAGSTITKNVPAGALGIARSRQRTIERWPAKREETGKKDEG